MNTYLVEVYTKTKKGSKLIHHKMAVSSKNTLQELQVAYNNKYLGFFIDISFVPVVEIQPIEKPETAIKPVVSQVIFKEQDYSMYGGSPDMYRAEITNENIKGYPVFRDKLEKNQKERQEIENEFKKHICETFSIKNMQDFKWHNQSVKFTFYTSQFNFKQ